MWPAAGRRARGPGARRRVPGLPRGAGRRASGDAGGAPARGRRARCRGRAAAAAAAGRRRTRARAGGRARGRGGRAGGCRAGRVARLRQDRAAGAPGVARRSPALHGRRRRRSPRAGRPWAGPPATRARPRAGVAERRCARAQGTKACLGWEREPEGGTYACTAVTDAWLALLALAFHAARLLLAAPAAEPAAAAAGAPDAPGAAAAGGRRASGEAPPELGRTGAAVASYAAALQELLAQLLLHWKARPSRTPPAHQRCITPLRSLLLAACGRALHAFPRSSRVRPSCGGGQPPCHGVGGRQECARARAQAVSPAVQPRALWVAAHHVALSGAADAGWVYLMRALGGALAGADDAARAGRHAPALVRPAPPPGVSSSGWPARGVQFSARLHHCRALLGHIGRSAGRRGGSASLRTAARSRLAAPTSIYERGAQRIARAAAAPAAGRARPRAQEARRARRRAPGPPGARAGRRGRQPVRGGRRARRRGRRRGGRGGAARGGRRRGRAGGRAAGRAPGGRL